MIAGRGLLLTIALAACAWFALGVRAAHDQAAVTSVLNQHVLLTASQARTAKSELAAAETLNPDQELEILRAQVELHSGHQPQALAIAKRVVAREPESAEAWLVLALMSGQLDPATNRLAHLRLNQLVSSAS